MELRHLRYFVAVAEELNFRRAAESLHIAQPALSQQIKQLEDEIGVRLLERTQHKVGVTAAGRVFYQHAQETLRAAQRATLQAQTAGQGEAGTITVGFVSSAAISVLPALLTSAFKCKASYIGQ